MLSFWRGYGQARPWIAMLAAYALALQALLGAVLTSQAALASDSFTICLAADAGAPPGHGGTGKSAAHDSCVLCTLAKGTQAILGAGQQAPSFDLVYTAPGLTRAIDRIVQYDSPTGQYQTGPPPDACAG